ncbi:FtsB family cell division protein [Heyndrickxia sp. NPDC080065]|uniref:FtsB family cell division protein n=1 Tax=Heyndrickxia sp. NPDC080065 TaxID=3390568 RepID=UPI003D0221D3
MGERARKNIAPMENNYIKQQQVKERALVRRRKLLFRRLTLFVILTSTIFYFLTSTLISRNDLLTEKKREKAKLEKSLAKLDKKRTLLQDEVVKLNDKEYIAKLARSEYFLSDDGEIIFNIPKPKEKNEEEDLSY